MPGLIWLQANCEVAATGDEAVHGVIRSLLAQIVRRRERTGLRRLHFVRKAPGLRIRLGFSSDDPTPAMIDAADRTACLLKPAFDEGLVRHWYPSAYEPEIHKYGGPATLTDVNAYFAADTIAWSRRIMLELTHAQSVDVRLWSVCLINDLILKLVDGLDEVWDVWCTITLRHGGTPTALGSPTSAPVLADLSPVATPGEQALAHDCARANSLFARRLIRRFEKGELLFGFRAILPHLVMAHWNRFGFSLMVRQEMCQRMMATLQ